MVRGKRDASAGRAARQDPHVVELWAAHWAAPQSGCQAPPAEPDEAVDQPPGAEAPALRDAAGPVLPEDVAEVRSVRRAELRLAEPPDLLRASQPLREPAPQALPDGPAVPRAAVAEGRTKSAQAAESPRE